LVGAELHMHWHDAQSGLRNCDTGACVSLNHRLPEFLPLLAASGLALLMTAAGIYHDLRRESAAPVVALFLLALFVIVGHLLG